MGECSVATPELREALRSRANAGQRQLGTGCSSNNAGDGPGSGKDDIVEAEVSDNHNQASIDRIVRHEIVDDLERLRQSTRNLVTRRKQIFDEFAMRASTIADSFQHIVSEFRVDQNRLNKVEEEIMEDRQRVAARIQELDDGDIPMISTPVRSSSSSSSSSGLSRPQAPPLRPRPHGDRYTQYRRQMSYLAVYLDNSTSSISIPSAFRPYDRKDEHKNEISNNTYPQTIT